MSQTTPEAFPGGDHAREIQHAIDMLVELIPDAHDGRYPDRVQRACRESFAMNARLLIDFVTGQDRNSDIRAVDFAGSRWNFHQPTRAGDVEEAWLLASKNVAHLSKTRTAGPLTYDIDEGRMIDIARLVVALIDAWVVAVEQSEHPDAGAFRSSIRKANALLAPH